MLLSLSGVHVDTCSGYDCVSHRAIPNHSAPLSSKLYPLPGCVGCDGVGSCGSVTWYRIRFPDPGLLE